MKLVLLPGMDGTGILFQPLLSALAGVEVFTLPLPADGPQDYDSLTAYVRNELPEEDFILLAESFSGGIAARLSVTTPNLKGMIFVASFLSSPGRLIARIAACLPLKLFARLPFAMIAYRILFLGDGAQANVFEQFEQALNEVPDPTLRARLRTIAHAENPGFTSCVPAVYIGASKDRLVPVNKREEFKQAYAKIRFIELSGPHFILQVAPQLSAEAIVESIAWITIESQ